MATTQRSPLQQSHRSTTALIIVLLASNVLASIDQSMMNVALDATATKFHVELAMANWTVLGFSIIAGTVIMAAAALLAHFGLHRIIMAGLIFSAAGSLLGLVSWDFWSLLAARFLQAVTSGLFFPVISAALLIVAPSGKKATLISLNSAVIGVGLAFSPVISGVLLTYLGLRWMFIVPLILSISLIIAGPFTLFDVEPRANRPVDAISVIVSFIGFFAFMYGLNDVTKNLMHGLIGMIIGTAVLAYFIYRQGRIAHPLLDLKPFKYLEFDWGEAVAMLCFMSSLYMSLLAPLYLEGTAGFTPFIAGCWLVTPILLYALSTYIGGRIEDKRGIWPLVPCGVGCVVIGLTGMAFAASTRSVIVFIVCCAVTYFGVGFVYAPMKSRDLELVPETMSSSASSIHSTLAQVVTSIASALFVGLMSSDSAHLMSQGASKADAYAHGFVHTLLIDLGIAIVSLLLSLGLVHLMRHRHELRAQ
ncbi:MFS transporter [Bifidobacterium gallicum]|uniref:Transporter, major facilitator family n=1 Tax=Bifidobacterium gallicum DSM 20093 = LMG 11596 TaxID=561180 RepID=D1NVS8_9BIFI|nr:MFS transporter [Bifidobacterium gallicum]EFA22929.1 transporter, major facilitator family protein [Bifidobacterium gallicum DSM 20093 = LMG 11596]KFI59375.1 transporter, major facilitator family [Bifidobacterium gallicum DSM 20093 = LMG 11596]